MSDNKPKGIAEFPLQESSARRIINDLAENHTNKIRWSSHIKKRMLERKISTGQILIMLKNKHSVFVEGPYSDAGGDWVFKLKGRVAGDIIELVVALKNHHDSPNAALLTVWIK